MVVSGARAWAYRLSYKQSVASGRSLLASVQRYGRDAAIDATGTVTGGSTLPAVTPSYQPNNNQVLRKEIAIASYCASGDLIVGDFNGDRHADVACQSPLTANTTVALESTTWPSGDQDLHQLRDLEVVMVRLRQRPHRRGYEP